MDIHQFDAIRPFEPTELPEVFDRLLQNEQFLQVLAYLYHGVPKEAIGMKDAPVSHKPRLPKGFLL